MNTILRRLENSILYDPWTLGANAKTTRLWPDTILPPLEPTHVPMPYSQDGGSLVVRAPVRLLQTLPTEFCI